MVPITLQINSNLLIVSGEWISFFSESETVWEARYEERHGCCSRLLVCSWPK